MKRSDAEVRKAWFCVEKCAQKEEIIHAAGDETIKNMPFSEKMEMALKYADWEGALYDSKALTISIISCTVIFGIIAITPIDELIELLASILELIGYGGAIAEAVHAIYDFADFFNRVKNAQSEKALQEANIRSVFMDELYKQFEELVLDNTSNFQNRLNLLKKFNLKKI